MVLYKHGTGRWSERIGDRSMDSKFRLLPKDKPEPCRSCIRLPAICEIPGKCVTVTPRDDGTGKTIKDLYIYTVENCPQYEGILRRRQESIDAEQAQQEKKAQQHASKTLHNTTVSQAKDNVRDIKVYGDGDTFRLLCKASSEREGWMKSTKVMNVPGGCVVQVSTQQGQSVAESVCFVPNVHIDISAEPRRMRHVRDMPPDPTSPTPNPHPPLTKGRD